MSDLLLSAETGRKEGTRPSRRLRREGKVPAVVYGLDADPIAVSVEWPELRRCLTTDAGLNALITLDIEGTNHLSVVKDIQRHPTRRDVLHVDFLRVTEDQLIDVNVPVVLIGEARNVTMYDGMVDQSMYEMTISVKPTAVPQQIEIDISELELGETIKVEDVELPEGAAPVMDPNETVAIARGCGIGGLEVIDAPSLPEGWSGKLWALENGSQRATRPYLWLVDADIEVGDRIDGGGRDPCRRTAGPHEFADMGGGRRVDGRAGRPAGPPSGRARLPYGLHRLRPGFRLCAAVVSGGSSEFFWSSASVASSATSVLG